jgi:hypothetical protein
LGQGEKPEASDDGAGSGIVRMNRRGRRTIMAMLPIAELAVIWNLIGH